MSNQLKMAQVQSILALSDRGWSQQRIARELEVDRETVARYVGLVSATPPIFRPTLTVCVWLEKNQIQPNFRPGPTKDR